MSSFLQALHTALMTFWMLQGAAPALLCWFLAYSPSHQHFTPSRSRLKASSSMAFRSSRYSILVDYLQGSDLQCGSSHGSSNTACKGCLPCICQRSVS